jgi:hypothetical protein
VGRGDKRSCCWVRTPPQSGRGFFEGFVISQSSHGARRADKDLWLWRLRHLFLYFLLQLLHFSMEVFLHLPHLLICFVYIKANCSACAMSSVVGEPVAYVFPPDKPLVAHERFRASEEPLSPAASVCLAR